MCWDAVDLDAAQLHVHRSVRNVKGKAVRVDTVKNAASFRTIGLPDPALDVLRAQHEAIDEAKRAASVWIVDDPGLTFPTGHGTPLDLSNVRDELTAICAGAGIARITPHGLRHSAASILNDQGVPIEAIADLLGHTDATMLLRTYRHRLRPSADAAVETMGRLFGSTNGGSRLVNWSVVLAGRRGGSAGSPPSFNRKRIILPVGVASVRLRRFPGPDEVR